MNRSFLVVGTILAAAIPTGASAQGDTRSRSCSALSSYEDWVAIASGVTCAANDAPITDLVGGVSFYVFGPWDPNWFAPPPVNTTTSNTTSNTSSNTSSNSSSNTTSTPNLGCSPYVRLPWDPPSPPPAPCNDNTSSGGDNTTQDPPPPPPADDQTLNTLVNEPNATPEPATLLLVASGLGGVGALARRRKARASTES